jgi:hypothetical protein
MDNLILLSPLIALALAAFALLTYVIGPSNQSKGSGIKTINQTVSVETKADTTANAKKVPNPKL